MIESIRISQASSSDIGGVDETIAAVVMVTCGRVVVDTLLCVVEAVLVEVYADVTIPVSASIKVDDEADVLVIV